MLRLAPLALALVLAGCGAGANWTKPGGTAAMADADWEQCRTAQRGPRGGIVGNSSGRRGQSGTGSGVGASAQTDQLVASRECMMERGWQPMR